MLKEFGAGQMVDIRDENYMWRIGRIIRVISRVGETHKYIKIQYLVNYEIIVRTVNRKLRKN